jgi:hypothetical protein
MCRFALQPGRTDSGAAIEAQGVQTAALAMTGIHKAPLCVSLKNVESLDSSDPLLDHIETALRALERRLVLSKCHVTVESEERGACRVRVVVTLADQRRATHAALGPDLRSAVDGAFAAI